MRKKRPKIMFADAVKSGEIEIITDINEINRLSKIERQIMGWRDHTDFKNDRHKHKCRYSDNVYDFDYSQS